MLAALLVLQFAVTAHATGEEELLPEHEAFAFNANLLPDNQLEVVWDIADGYYMYRDKFGFDIVGGAQLADPVVLPKGKEKFDELFGNVEVYVDQLKMVFEIKPDPGASDFTLLAQGQGCNEPVGVCYPPIKHEIAFNPNQGGSSNISTASPSLQADGLVNFSGIDSSPSALSKLLGQQPDQPAPDQPEMAFNGQNQRIDNDASADQPEIDSVSALRELLSAGFEQPEYLPVEDAFQLDMSLDSERSMIASFNVADGYYLYKKQMSFRRNGLPVNDLELPEGVIKEDEYFGESKVFRNTFSIPVDLATNGSSAQTVTVQATYQGCADEGICYPPVTTSVDFTLPALISTASADSGTTPSAATSTSGLTGSSDSAAQRSFWGLMVGALFAGLLLTFTPCVLPLIPILSSVIAGQGERITRSRGGFLALIYVLGTAVTYAGMGALAGATGEQLQAYFQNIWAIGALALIFVIMALSMFGLFELQLPSSLQSRLQNSTQNLSGSVAPVFILGLVSALIVGACVSPVLISFLGVAVSRADPVLGAQLMFAMALGMGVPLIALGFGAGYLIPRAGQWMERVKHLFGIMLIGVAIYMLGVLPQVPVLLLWAVYFIVLSVYLGATQQISEGSSGWTTLQKGVGTVLLVWGVVALIGGFYGQRDLFRPLPDNLLRGQPGSTIAANHATVSPFTRVSSPAEFSEQLQAANLDGKNVVVDFYADWCVDCIKMEKTTFENNQVVTILESDYIALQIDVTDPGDPGTSAVKKQLGVFGPPAVLFFDQQGQRRKHKDFYGYKNTEEFLALLETQ